MNSYLAGKAAQSGKTITVENPEIVNGLQTSTEIHAYFANSTSVREDRNLLVRVIVPKAAESRDRVIRATNSQTAIPPASLRATDRIHRDIEQYLKAFGFYYDRRKNFYKNEGKPASRIISIPLMAQAVMAIVLRRPDSARARPSSLIKRDEEYLRLFTDKYPIEVYLVCAQITKRVDGYLASFPQPVSAADRNNIRFYVAMVVANEALRKSCPGVTELASLANVHTDDAVLRSAYDLVAAEYNALGGTDQVAKGTDLVTVLNRKLQERLPASGDQRQT